MRRLVVFLIIFAVLLGLGGCYRCEEGQLPGVNNTSSQFMPSNAEGTGTSSSMPEENQEETPTELVIDYSMAASDRYFAFVYNEEDAWLNEYLGDNVCIPGYLYVEDREAEEIRLLTTESVKILRDTPNALFCIMEDDSIIRMDYFGQNMETIYQASRGVITFCERLDSQLCFVEGDYIICLDLLTLKEDIVLHHENITKAFLLTAEWMIWEEESGQVYLHYRWSGANIALTEQEFRSLISRPGY